jgi:hypothetical protein
MAHSLVGSTHMVWGAYILVFFFYHSKKAEEAEVVWYRIVPSCATVCGPATAQNIKDIVYKSPSFKVLLTE